MSPYTMGTSLLLHTKSKETTVAIITELLSQNLCEGAFGVTSTLEESSGLGLETLSKIGTYFSEGRTHMYIENQKISVK